MNLESRSPVSGGSLPSRAAALALTILAATALPAAVCTVPGTHSTIQAAIDDTDCNPIQLAEGDYPESPIIDRTLVVDGPGSAAATLWGRLEVTGSGVTATVDGLEVWSACAGPAVESEAGARVEALDLPVVKTSSGACHEIQRIFTDGFESGDTTSCSP